MWLCQEGISNAYITRQRGCTTIHSIFVTGPCFISLASSVNDRTFGFSKFPVFNENSALDEIPHVGTDQNTQLQENETSRSIAFWFGTGGMKCAKPRSYKFCKQCFKNYRGQERQPNEQLLYRILCHSGVLHAWICMSIENRASHEIYVVEYDGDYLNNLKTLELIPAKLLQTPTIQQNVTQEMILRITAEDYNIPHFPSE